MGALTLKSFPFELRGWESETYESIDPTDSFGQNILVHIENNQILKIEPRFSNNISNTWITDKGRQFFDTVFQKNNGKIIHSIKNFQQWNSLFKIIYKTLYIFNICNSKTLNKKFFIIIFEFLNLEYLNFLYSISQIYPFIKLKRSESVKITNNLESDYQINSALSKTKLISSSLCLLVGVNTRYENSHLNLKLRQRFLKGNISFLIIGSLFNFTFSAGFLGSNISILKTIIEGNNSFCQNFKISNNPILVSNTELFQRTDSKNLINFIKIIKFTNIISKIWNGLNILNSNITETGTNSLFVFSFLNFKDLLNFNSFYIINVNLLYMKNFKKLTELKLTKFFKKPLLIDQNSQKVNISFVDNKILKFKKYIYVPVNTYFENSETFLNTEGVLKKTIKLVFKQKSKNNWHLIRKFAKKLKFLNNRINHIFFKNENRHNLKNFINFNFHATQSLTDLNFYLNTKNKPFVIYKLFLPFKIISIKLFNTKIKYWLDDFFLGDKDNYCNNSLSLTNCSINIRTQDATFF